MLRSLAPAGVAIPVRDIAAACRALLFRDNTPLQLFKDGIRQAFGVEHAFFASSGRASLVQLFTAMAKLESGRDEVLLPAYTSFSVPSAVVRAGLKVSLYDVDPKTLSPDIESLSKALSDKTLCVVACHLFGYPCDMDAVAEVMKSSGAFLVDDAAQAMGANYKGRPVGTLGDAGLFSLSRGKNITTVDGGIIVTDSVALAAEMAKIPLERLGCLEQVVLILKALVVSLLLRPCFYWVPRNLPFLQLGASVFDSEITMQEYTACQAAIGIRMLDRLPAITEKRRQVAVWLRDALDPQVKKSMVSQASGEESVSLRFPLIGSVELLEDHAALGIVSSYPLPLDSIEGLKPYLVGSGPYPGAEKLANELFTLPTHAYVSENDVARITQQVNKSFTNIGVESN